MKFVWVTRQTPLIPFAGAYSYSNGLLRGLLSTGATGVLVSYERPGGPQGEAPGLQLRLSPPPKAVRALSILGGLPSDAFRLRSRRLETQLAEAVKPDVDALIVDFYAMGWLLQLIRKRRGKRLIVVYVSHQYEQALRFDIARDYVGSALMKQALLLDASKAARLERRMVEASDIITSIIEQDRIRFMSDAPGKMVITLVPGYDKPAVPARRIGSQTPRRVILVGHFEWIAKKRNFRRFLDAAEAPFEAAGIELMVVGRAEPAFVNEILARSTICRFTGEVPDIMPFMAQGRIGLMPDEVGGGFKLKVLDYIFGQLPVAAISSQVSDLPLDMQNDIIARKNVADLVAAIVGAIDDIEFLNGMSQRALAACKDAFDWNERGRRLAAAIESCNLA